MEEKLKKEIELVKRELEELKKLFYLHKHTGVDKTNRLNLDNQSVSIGSKITFNTDYHTTSYINFDYNGIDGDEKTAFRMFQEENGGPLIIQSAVQSTPKESVKILDDYIILDGGDEIVLTAGETFASGIVWAKHTTATPAGGTKVFKIGSAGLSICYGSGAPTLSAPKGSLYLRTDGSSTSTRAYINTNGSTTWTAITTAA